MAPARIAHVQVAHDLASKPLAARDASAVHGLAAFALEDVAGEAIPVGIPVARVEPCSDFAQVVGEPVRHVHAKGVTRCGNGAMHRGAAAILHAAPELAVQLPQDIELIGNDDLLIGQDDLAVVGLEVILRVPLRVVGDRRIPRIRLH
jgi:hypothetical protein